MINTKKITCSGPHTYFPYIQVYEAITLVNGLLAKEEFYERIAGHPDFDMADVSPDTIAALMRKARLDMSVDLYYALNPLKEIDGYDDNRNPSVIHMNIWKIDRPVASLCNSLVHAVVHAVNAFYDRFSFGHGTGTGGHLHNTAPYAIGAIAESMITQQDSLPYTLEHDFFDTSHKGLKELSFLSFDARTAAQLSLPAHY